MRRTLGAGTRTFSRTGRTLLVAAALAAGVVVPGAAAQGLGPAIVAGQATVSTPKPGTTIVQQTTEKAILNWPSLSVPTGNLLQFQQPNSAAIALNRVLGGVTTIDGSLIANGRVWIINPNGVLFGSGASVNVAGLIATASDIDNQDFLDGNYKFGIAPTNPDAAITNAGRITATGGGAVVLAGPQVANTGVIEARLGEVVLGGADKFTVDFTGDKLLSFAINAPVTPPQAGATANPPAALVSNSGRISADGGTVLLTARAARGVLDNVVNTSGMISATTAHEENGTIVLDAGPGGTASVDGSLDVSGQAAGETGGTVAVLGHTVAVDAGARIDAAGDAGGGTVLIGGNLHGAGPQPDAKDTMVAPGAVIDASAITSGNGGTVAVWADDDTIFNGTIEVRGGAKGGNGGLAETSGTQLSVTTGTVDALAPQGQTGTWLLDPTDIVVKTGGMSSIADANNDNFFLVNIEYDIDPATIEQANANVTLTAGDSITFANSVTMANIGVGITAMAANSIIVDPGVAITTQGGAISFLANDLPNTVISPTGHGGITIDGTLSTAGGGQSGGGASLAVIGGTGVITLAQNITTAGGAITLAGPTSLAAAVTLDTTNGGLFAAGAAVSVTGTLDGPGGMSIAAGGGAITLDGAVGLQAPLASLAAAGATITIGGALAVTGTVDTTGVGLTTIDGTVTAGSIATGTVTLDGASIETAQGQSYGAATIGTGGASLTDTGGSAIAFTGTLDGPGGLAIADSGGAITLDGDVGHGVGLASLGATGATIAFDGTLDVTGVVDTTQVGITTIAGTVTAGSIATGAVALDGASIETAQGQSYGAATIGPGGASLADTGGSMIAFTGTLAGPGGLAIADGGGAITLDGDAGAGSPLASLSATGATIAFDGTLGVAGALDTTRVGLTSFTGAVAAGSVATGAVTMNGASIETAQGQSYGVATIGAGGASLTDTGGSAIVFTGTLDGPGGLAIADDGGAITLAGDVGSASPLASLSASGATIAFDGTLGIAGALDTTRVGLTSVTGAVTAGSVATGAVTLDGAAVTTAAGQSYGAATIGTGGASLTDTGGSAIVFSGTLDGPGGLSIADSGGAITLAGDVGHGAALASLGAAGATIAFDGTLDVTGAVDTTQVWLTTITGAVAAGSVATGAVTLNGASIETAQDQSYGAATIGTGGASLTDTGGSVIVFSGTLDGPGGLSIADSGGAVTLAGAVGSASPLASLTASAAMLAFDDGLAVAGLMDTTRVGLTAVTGTAAAASVATGAVAFNTASITTTAGQTYGAATLNGDTTLTDTSRSADITFTGTLDGDHALDIDAGGTLAFKGDVGGSMPLASLNADAKTMIAFNGTLAASGQVSVATPGIETFSGAVTIGGPFDADNATFYGTVTAKSLAADNVTIAGGAVTTSSGQSYFGATTLGADTILTDTGSIGIDFTASVSGPYALTVVNPGGAFDLSGATLGSLGTTSRTADLTGTITVAGAIDTSGSSVTDLEGTVTATSVRTSAVNLAGAVTTSAGQSYGATMLLDTTSLTDTGASAIHFESTVSGGSFGPVASSLMIVDAGGAVAFDGTVSMAGALDTTAAGFTTFSGTVTAGSVATGAVALDGGSVSTSSGQSYGTAVLGTATELTDASVGGITFAGSLTGTPALTVIDSNAFGNVAFNSIVTLAGALDTSRVYATTFGGAVTAASVNTGLANINGGSVTTSSGQSYQWVAFNADTVLTDTGASPIAVAEGVYGPKGVTINDAGGAVTLGGFVSENAPASFKATAATVSFNNLAVVTGDLDTTAVGLTTFGGGPVDGGVAAGTVSTGAVAMSPGITISTSGGQSYGAATLGGATVVEAGGNVTFGGTLTGPGSLVVQNASGAVAFNGAVALTGALDTTAVGSTTFNASVTAASVATGAVALNGGSVTTTNGQSYGVIPVSGASEGSYGGDDGSGDFTSDGAGTTSIIYSDTGITFAAAPSELAASHIAAVRDTVPADAPAGGGAATLGTDTVLRDGGGAIAFDGTLDGAHSLAVADAGGAVTFNGAVGGTTPLTNFNAAAATIAFGGPVAVTGALNTNAAGLTNFGGTVTAASISTGPFAISGDTTLAATGDVTFAGNSLFNNGFALDVLAGGNVTVAGAVQNGGAGSIAVVAGWDGVTPAAQVAATPGAYGGNGGSVVIAGGTTTIAAANLTVAAANGFAQLGYAGTGATGAIGVTLTGGLTLSGGTAANDYAQIGHGGERIGGSESGDIAIAAAGDVTLAGGSGSLAYAQIGHGGAFSNEDATAGFTDTGTIAVAGDVVTLSGGSGSGAYAQIGHGGLGAAQDAAVATGSINFSGTIAVAATGTLTLSGAGPEAYAQIGNGGYQSVDGTTIAQGAGITESGDITVTTGTTSSAGALQVMGDAYAQIGNGGYAANVDTNAPSAINEFGDIDVTVNGAAGTALVAGGGTGAFGYAQIGNGDAATVGVGNVGGDIAITVATTVDLRQGTNANAGIWNATGFGTVSGTTMVNGAIVLSSDETLAPPPPPPPLLPSPTLIAPWLTAANFGLSSESLNSLTNGDLSLDTLGSSLNAIAPSSGDSGAKGPIESMTDSGKGTGTVLAGGNGASALPGGGGPAGSANSGALPGAAQEADDLSSGIAHTLSGTPGNVAHAAPQAILIGGLLTAAAPPLSARETPRALEPADEVYSSWGNEALWDWR